MNLNRLLLLIGSMALFIFPLNRISAEEDSSFVKLRPPAIPLVTIDPYTSCWSATDKLYDSQTIHWTGKPHSMNGLIRIDEKTKRFMGTAEGIEVIPQISSHVYALQSVYSFADDVVELKITFTSPLLPDDLDILSRPLSYITFDLKSKDGKKHDAQIYFDASAEWAVDTPEQKVEWKRFSVPSLQVMALGTVEQNILGTSGDDRRIDWGYMISAVSEKNSQTNIGSLKFNQKKFADTGTLPESDDKNMTRCVKDDMPGLSTIIKIELNEKKSASCHIIIGYDDIKSIEYFGNKLNAWWRRNPDTKIETIIAKSEEQYDELIKRCQKMNAQVYSDALKAGGSEYADLCCVVFRQAIAAHKLVADTDGKPLFLSKENFSNGSIGTVDVTYPSTPLFFVYNSELVKGMMEPIFNYRESGIWQYPFAPHDVGTYPLANGQTYGGHMPVEESGNMLILSAAICEFEGNFNYAKSHWLALSEWAEYLSNKGFDPENQLCTDDFAGHLAHNINLSVKAIVALKCYAKMAAGLDKKDVEKKYNDLAKDLAEKWVKEAADEDHYSLTFDKKGTWSQKYNLIWDKVLGLNLFPKEVAEKEIKYYLTKQNKYGLPLDSRKTYTKSDWIIWTASLAGSEEDFKSLIQPVWNFVNETPDRIPVSDWHETTDGKSVGFRARSVVGGYYMKMLANRSIQKNRTSNFKWESFVPASPVRVSVISTSENSAQAWKYTLEKPADKWFESDFNDNEWKTGKAPFCSKDTPLADVQTEWTSSDIWLRKEFDVKEISGKEYFLRIRHDDESEIFINGKLIVKCEKWSNIYKDIKLTSEIKNALKIGKNIIAIHCRQDKGGQFIDAGILKNNEELKGETMTNTEKNKSAIDLKYKNNTIYYQAHRGGLREVPEHTIETYQYAWNLGGIPETDIRTTKDGVIICMHDKNLKRTTNAPDSINTKDIAELTYDEIINLDAGVKFGSQYAGQKIPTLKEVFAIIKENPEYKLYIDLKDVDLQNLAAIIKEYGISERIIMAYNVQADLKKFKEYELKVKTMLWIGGKPDAIKASFEKAKESGFSGLDQVQLHLHNKKNTAEIQYELDDEYLKYAGKALAEKGLDFEVLPFEFSEKSLIHLLDLGIYWYATDYPKKFTDTILAKK